MENELTAIDDLVSLQHSGIYQLQDLEREHTEAERKANYLERACAALKKLGHDVEHASKYAKRARARELELGAEIRNIEWLQSRLDERVQALCGGCSGTKKMKVWTGDASYELHTCTYCSGTGLR